MSSQNLSVFGYAFSFVSAFANAFVTTYNADEAASFRQRNREAALDLGLTLAAIGYEAMDSAVRFMMARAASDTSLVYGAAKQCYYTKQTVNSLETAYDQWLFIGEYTGAAAQIMIECSALIAAFTVAAVKVWAEEQVESCIAQEGVEVASEQQLSIEGFVPFALLSPVAEVAVEVEVVEPTVAPTFTVHHSKAVVKSLGKMNQVKSILGSSSSSWASLAADLILFATEGGYYTLEEAVAALKGTKTTV